MNRALCLALALSSWLAPASALTQRQSLPASPGESLVVDLTTGASMRIRGWEQASVSVEAEFTGPDADNVRFEARRSGDRIEISTSFLDPRRDRSGGQLSIQVPQRFDLRLLTAGGGIRIEGVAGRLEGETMGGELELHDLEGTLNLATHGGDVALTDSRVQGELTTHGGNIRLRNVNGAVSATSMGGDVIYDNVDPGGADAEVRISTMGGNIDLPEAPHGADLETMGGDIVVGRAADHVNAKTMGGDIRLDAVDGRVIARTGGGRIDVTLKGSGDNHDVRLTSAEGRVTLRLPAGLSMDIDVTLAYTRNSDPGFSIRSDFPLEIRQSENWDYSGGSRRKYIYGTGRTGGGTNKIKIETTNGDVVLIKEP